MGKKRPYIDMDTLREQEGWLDVYYEYDQLPPTKVGGLSLI